MLKYTTILDTSSLFLAKKLLPFLNEYEWSMRKLIYLVVPNYFNENWIQDTFSEETISRIKEKLKGKWKPENLLQWLDLSDFEEYLFGENYVRVSGEGEESVLKVKNLVQKSL